MTLHAREVGAPRSPRPPAPPSIEPELEPDQPVYTRYCAAPQPLHPVGEPRYVRALSLAAWLGRLGFRHGEPAPRM